MMEVRLLSAAVQPRKSFKNHQQIKRKGSPRILIFILSILLSLYCIMHHSCSQPQPIHPPELRQASNQSHNNVAEEYLRSYCHHQHACGQQNIQAISAILNLIENSHSSPEEELHPAVEAVLTTIQSAEPGINGQFGLLPNGKYIDDNFGFSRLRQISLQVVKHPKVTTPPALTFLEQLSSIFASSDTYRGIDNIVEGRGQFVWRPNTMAVSVAVRSHHPFKPTTFEIGLEMVDSQPLQILGLTITLDQKIILANLGTFSVRQGINRFNCLAIQCDEAYDALIFKMGWANIFSIKVFEAMEE